MTMKEVQEESSQSVVGCLDRNVSNHRNHETFDPRQYPCSESNRSNTEYTGDQHGVAQACSAVYGLPGFGHWAITNLLDMNYLDDTVGRASLGGCQRFSSVSSTSSQYHLISIIDDALALLREDIEEFSE